jgi:hypothetical protein
MEDGVHGRADLPAMNQLSCSSLSRVAESTPVNASGRMPRNTFCCRNGTASCSTVKTAGVFCDRPFRLKTLWVMRGRARA